MTKMTVRKKVLVGWVLILFITLTGVVWAEDEGTEITTAYMDTDTEPTWIISNELIGRLDLEPSDSTTYNLVIEGEDGKWYDWCGILKAHMDWVEEKLGKVKEVK